MICGVIVCNDPGRVSLVGVFRSNKYKSAVLQFVIILFCFIHSTHGASALSGVDTTSIGPHGDGG